VRDVAPDMMITGYMKQEERKIVYSSNDQYGRKEYIGPIVNGKRHGEQDQT